MRAPALLATSARLRTASVSTARARFSSSIMAWRVDGPALTSRTDWLTSTAELDRHKLITMRSPVGRNCRASAEPHCLKDSGKKSIPISTEKLRPPTAAGCWRLAVHRLPTHLARRATADDRACQRSDAFRSASRRSQTARISSSACDRLIADSIITKASTVAVPVNRRRLHCDRHDGAMITFHQTGLRKPARY